MNKRFSRTCCPNGDHRWPRIIDLRDTRSIGIVTYEQCNDCLAVRIVQLPTSNDPTNDHETITIVEPR